MNARWGTAIIAMVIADQAIKQAVELYLPMQRAVELLPVLSLYRTYNTGIAFSMLDALGDKALIALAIVIMALVLWLWRRTDKAHWPTHLGFALVIAGALGNLIDRIAYGHVIDYILVHYGQWSFAVFNLADSFITVGAVLIVLDELFGRRSETGDQDRGGSVR